MFITSLQLSLPENQGIASPYKWETYTSDQQDVEYKYAKGMKITDLSQTKSQITDIQDTSALTLVLNFCVLIHVIELLLSDRVVLQG